MSDALVSPAPGALVPSQSDNDAQLVSMWVARSSSPNTRKNYQRQAERFLAAVGKPLQAVSLKDVQDYMAGLDAMAPSTKALAVSAVKSLLTFGHEIGYLGFNVGRVVKAPPVKNVLAERILCEADALRMVQLEPNVRNRAMLTLLYGAGLRISEVAGLLCRDLAPRDDAGQITVYGKGGKTRVVLLSAASWKLLQACVSAEADAPVFRSRQGGALDASQIHRVLKAAAARAGLSAEVSAHGLRHAHASRSLDWSEPSDLERLELEFSAPDSPAGRSGADEGLEFHGRSLNPAHRLDGAAQDVASGLGEEGALWAKSTRRRESGAGLDGGGQLFRRGRRLLKCRGLLLCAAGEVVGAHADLLGGGRDIRRGDLDVYQQACSPVALHVRAVPAP